MLATFRAVSLAVAILAPIAGASPPHKSDEYLMVSLRPEELSDLTLHFRLTNTAGKAVVIRKGDLPWGNRYAILLVVTPNDGVGECLSPLLPIDDSGPGTIRIRAGESREGRISLEERFPTLRESLKKRDLLILWSYQLRPQNDSPFPRVYGGLLIGRQP
jgi:hypothetical protein